MNFGHSSKIHLVTGRMFRKEINITVRKAREGGPKMTAPTEPPTWRSATQRGNDTEASLLPFTCFISEVTHHTSRATFHPEASPRAGSIYIARDLHNSHLPACSLLLLNNFFLSPCCLSSLAIYCFCWDTQWVWSQINESRVVCNVTTVLLMMNKSSSPQPP